MVSPNLDSIASPLAEIHRLYDEEGLGLKAIMRRTGISYSRVREALIEKTVGQVGKQRAAVTPEQISEMVELYGNGSNIGQIAAHFKKHYKTVKHCLKISGVTFRGKNTAKEFGLDQQNDIIDRYVAGESILAISSSYDCSHKPILRLLARRGVAVRDRKEISKKRIEGEQHCLPKSVFDTRKRGAIRLGNEWQITIEEIDALFEKQKGLCSYTGLPMAVTGNAYVYSASVKDDPRAVSIDRVDSSVGYTHGNVVLCCRFINLAKNQYSDSLFRDILSKAAHAICDREAQSTL